MPCKAQASWGEMQGSLQHPATSICDTMTADPPIEPLRDILDFQEASGIDPRSLSTDCPLLPALLQHCRLLLRVPLLGAGITSCPLYVLLPVLLQQSRLLPRVPPLGAATTSGPRICAAHRPRRPHYSRWRLPSASTCRAGKRARTYSRSQKVGTSFSLCPEGKV